MDKVLVHRAFSTLNLVVIGMAGIAIFEIVLTLLRSLYIYAYCCTYGCGIRRKIIQTYFWSLLFLTSKPDEQVKPLPESGNWKNIRSFLTGNAITVVMDTLFSVLFLAVMYYYSPFLTLIVVLSLPVYFLLSLFVTPTLRANLNEKFARGAENQAFLG